ncbi:MAG: archaeosortase/exosortase family protein [Oligoflexia bacterium]|nr:archaeosortase/exosortase family protein [Oligoflexia bacterium]
MNLRYQSIIANTFFFIMWISVAILIIHRLTNIEHLIEFYPLIFMPYFISGFKKENDNNKNKHSILISIVVGIFFITGIYFKMWAIIWLGSWAIFMITLKTFGANVSLAYILLLLVSPPFDLKFDIFFGHHLRQYATAYAVTMLKIFNPSTIQIGNGILIEGKIFYVEKICEGLKLASALVVTLLLLWKHYTINTHKTKSFLYWTMVVFISALLWFLSNVFRIFLLTRLDIPPENPFHELIGITIFICVVITPLLLISFLLFSRRKQTTKFKIFNLRVSPKHTIIATITLLLVLFANYSNHEIKPSIYWPQKIESFFKMSADENIPTIDDVAIYKNVNSYLILKNNLNPIRVAHHPLQCWQAIGYLLTGEQSIAVDKIKDQNIRKHLIIKNGIRYNLVWFYLIYSSKNLFISDSEWIWRKQKLINAHKVILVNWFAQENIIMPNWIELSVRIITNM